jgi:hypothetical protein
MEHRAIEAQSTLRWFFGTGLVAGVLGSLVWRGSESAVGVAAGLLLFTAGCSLAGIAVIGWGVMYGVRASGLPYREHAQLPAPTRGATLASDGGSAAVARPVTRARKRAPADIDPLGPIG